MACSASWGTWLLLLFRASWSHSTDCLLHQDGSNKCFSSIVRNRYMFFPFISRTKVHISLMVHVLFLHGLILIPSHWVTSVIDVDSPRCQAIGRASAYPLRINLNDLTSGTAGLPPEFCRRKSIHHRPGQRPHGNHCTRSMYVAGQWSPWEQGPFLIHHWPTASHKA